MIFVDHVTQHRPCCQWIPRNTTYSAMNIDCVEINTSLPMMKQCALHYFSSFDCQVFCILYLYFVFSFVFRLIPVNYEFVFRRIQL